MELVACESAMQASSGVAAVATPAAPVCFPAAVETINVEPWLHVLSACMVGTVVIAFILDLVTTRARRSGARNRKKISLERLRNLVDVQQKRARGIAVAASAAHMEHATADERQSTLCADESAQPLLLPVKRNRQSDQPVTPPSSPPPSTLS